MNSNGITNAKPVTSSSLGSGLATDEDELGNYLIQSDVNAAKSQSPLLFQSIDDYMSAEQSGFIPKEITGSMEYNQVRADIVNVIFSGESHSFNGSMNYKDTDGNLQSIGGEQYQKMVNHVGMSIYNKQTGTPYKSYEVPKTESTDGCN